ncbi:MAG TPA: type II toxin-antitoxin system prevent-host-death family antitoxin [Thermoanaerobaculia bacterium]|nr:type II toxin-antitoxin system prevent-host-death family antitoxin [Thermoanaerobaculia bacterium]
MKKATISETKNNLSALIRRVKNGETILIVDRDTPVARLEPIRPSDETDDERLARLEKAGIIRRGTGKYPKEILERDPPRARKGASIVAALLKDREESM